MGEEVGEYQGAYKVTQGLLDEFGPTRVVDTPITEHGFAGVGVGAAFAGLKPIVEFMTWNFAMQAIDHIINSAAKTLYMSGGKMRCPIVFRGPNGAAARVAAQHSQDYAAWYAHVPGLKVIAPYTAADAKGLLKAAIRDPRPGGVPRKRNPLRQELRGARSSTISSCRSARRAMARAGKHVTIVSSRAAWPMRSMPPSSSPSEGIEAEVIDLRTLRPLDMATVLASVSKTNRLVAVEEGWPVCSVGSEICARVVAEAFDLSRCAAGSRHRRGRADALRRQSRKARTALGRSGRRGGESRSATGRDAHGRSTDESGGPADAIAARCASRCWRLTQVEAKECNCSICRKAGLSASHRREGALPPAEGADKITTYSFNTGTAKHHFCSVCGVKSFYVPRSKPDGYSVNLRCLDDGQVRVRKSSPVRRPHWEQAFAAAQGKV